MTLVSNDPALWSFISDFRFSSYFTVACSTMVVYDWALSFGQEFKLIWMQRWSFMTVLYICVRYIGILYSAVIIPWQLPVMMTDKGCNTSYFIWIWTPVVVNVILGVIMMTRVYAMYQGSKKMLVFLVIMLLGSTIASAVMAVIANLGISAEEAVLSGYRICLVSIEQDGVQLNVDALIPTDIWEILVFLLVVWIVIKHFRELRQSPNTSTIGDCFTMLTKSHAFYFLVFATVACFSLGNISPNILFSPFVGAYIYTGTLAIIQTLQMFVLGPRLILSVRNFNAKLVARSDEGTAMTTIVFQAGNALTGGDTSVDGYV